MWSSRAHAGDIGAASPFDRLAELDVLRAAWGHVRRSAEVSSSAAIRLEARRFSDDADAQLERIAQDLRAERFLFAPALGVAKTRPDGRSRPIVVAPLASRIVTRALLDVLLSIPAVIELALGAPNSFGGLPGRGVPHAITAAVAAVQAGATFHVRSDIADFFGKIPRARAISAVERAAADERLARLIERATRTELANLADLGDAGALFPGERRGVAQGNSLSTLLGNVVLRGFDESLNGRGVTCLRYVDDFLLLGARAAYVKKAFAGAERILGELDMRAYDPEREPRKAAMGETARGVAWLGCELKGGRAWPSAASRRALLVRVDRLLRDGARAADLPAALSRVDDALRAFRGVYAFCDCPEVFAALDARVARKVERVSRRARVRPAPGLSRRRA